MVRRYDVGQGQTVNVHHGTPDVLQLRLADHALVHNAPRVGVDVVDAEYRQDIGQQRHNPQEDDGENQPLL